jgi:cell division protein FtsI (penicillin-binding protein 3)
MPDHKPGGYGKISVKRAFEVSSNIAISKMVYARFGSDPQRYIDYINSFGLSQPLGFQMIGEGMPKIKNPSDKSWSGITLPWMSIGYEVELTPLQILAFYNAIANDGKLIRPIIVKSVKQADNM